MEEDSNDGESVDRLSELPDSLLIFHIFKFLPIRDVVRTIILSKRWENLWITVPYLNFHHDHDANKQTQDAYKFISWALMLWKGTKIPNLEIKFTTHVHNSMFDGIDLLLRFAKEHEVEELDIDLRYDQKRVRTYDDVYSAPHCLYSCSSLKRLCIHSNYLFHIPMIKNVKWDQLEELRITDHLLSEASIKKVLSGSPKLKILALVYSIKINENLSIESSSLRVLRIHIKKMGQGYEYPLSMDTELRISTPNLERLDLRGVSYSKIVMMNNAPCLTHAALLFDWFLGYDFVGQTLTRILPLIQHVKVLRLTDDSTKMLGEMGKKNKLSSFPNVWCLDLFSCFEEYKETMHLLEIFPDLTKLVLHQEKCSKGFCQHKHGKELLESERNIPISFLQKLRIIEIVWNKPVIKDPIFLFIETLVKYESKLERMVYRYFE